MRSVLAWFKKEWTTMIEFVNDKERNLKNLKQIGTPKEENKIYVEHMVYAKIKENTYKEKRVFVLMGHTERMEGRYVTFIEGIIPIREIDFQGNTPRWNNSTWSEIFREIKRLYEDMIIVGWAMDIKGMSPKVTPELERVHREHFGGVHQLLFLLDTMEQEETFYIYKENKVTPKDGFYIYHRARRKETIESFEQKKEIIPVKVLEQKREVASQRNKHVDVEVDIEQKEEEPKRWQGGRYRQLMNEKKPQKVTDDGNLGIAIAVAMLVFVIGVGVYEDRDKIFGTSDAIQTNLMQEQEEKDTQTSADLDKEEESEVEDTEVSDAQTDAEVIPVDVIPGTEQTN